MTDNAKLDDLIDRLQGGESGGEIDNAIADLVDQPLLPGSVLERKIDHDGLPMWRVKHAGQNWSSWGHEGAYSRSLDAAMSLARNRTEAAAMIRAAHLVANADPLGDAPFDPVPCIRAMLIERLKARRT